MKPIPSLDVSRFNTAMIKKAFFTLALTTNLVCAEQPLRLISEGKPEAVIVLAREPSVAAVQGAEILSDHLFQISGARLETIREKQLNADDSRKLILIGKSNLATQLGATSEGLGPGGILIRTYPKALVLLGPDSDTPNDPSGTRYAVTTFLEDHLGVRFLWPGEMGKVVPQNKTIEIPAIDHQFSPSIAQRRIRSAAGYGERKAQGGDRLGVTEKDYWRINNTATATKSKDGGWFGWHRQGGTLRLASGHAFSHIWEKYKDSHPEWFAMGPDGSRDQSRSPDRARLCISNEELIDAIAQEKIDQLNKSNYGSVSIGPNDGGQTAFCTCPECEKLDPPVERKPGEPKSLTDRYVHFFNGIAERVTKVHPDAWLTADAYSLYAAPPVNAKLHPNVAIRYVGVSYNNEEKRQKGLNDWVEWSKAADKIYFRSNLLLAGRRQGTPAIYIHKLAEDFRYIANHSMLGTDFDSCCHNWATQGLNYYVLGKLLWDPNQDVDVLFDDYCRSGFGSGAESIKKYFLRLEELTNQIAEGQLHMTVPYTPEVVAGLRGLLDQADKATRDEPAANKRVEFIRSGLEYTDAFAAFFRLEAEHKASGGGRLPPEMKSRMREALDKNWLVSRDIFKNHHLAVNVPTVAWGTWAYFARFGWSEPSEAIRLAADPID